MKTSEDFISYEVQGGSKWRHPLPKKHLFACAVTMLSATVLAVFNPVAPNIPRLSSDSDPAIHSSPYHHKDIDDTELDSLDYFADSVPLSSYFAQNHENVGNDNQVTVSVDPNAATDNYDDLLPDSALADSDDALDEKVKTLASKDDEDKDVANETELKWFEEDVQNGDSISSIFSDLNIPASVTMAILDNKKVASEVNSLSLGDHLSFLLDDKSRLMAFVKPLDKKQQIRFYRDDPNKNSFAYVIEKLGSHLQDGDDVVVTIKPQVAKNDDKADAKANDKQKVVAEAKKDKKADTKQLAEQKPQKKVSAHDSRGRLVIVTIGKGETFSTAANNAGVSYAEINKILNLFKGRIQFSRNVRAGDTMRVLFTDSKGKGKISAVEFSLQGRKVSAFLNPKDGKYYDERGINSKSTASFRRFPFDAQAKVTSPFNPSRRHPVTGVVRPHNGIDFGMPVGTPVLSPSDGVVTKAEFNRSTGYYVVIRHRGAYSTVFMHLSKISVKVGQNVKMGTVIARSGNTGLSTGPHLHYELRINGRPVNALRVKLNGIVDNTNNNERKRFAANIQTYKRDLYNQKLLAKR